MADVILGPRLERAMRLVEAWQELRAAAAAGGVVAVRNIGPGGDGGLIMVPAAFVAWRRVLELELLEPVLDRACSILRARGLLPSLPGGA